MKTLFCTFLCLAGVAFGALADSTISADNRFAYGANIGWLDFRADGVNGAVIGESVCSGYIYAANVGWIHLGDGSPANLVRYQNNSAADYGVNHDGVGRLRGYAYGANIGWVNFEDQGAPTVDLLTGVLSGYIYAANAGWISLNNTLASGTRVFVQTSPLASPDSDGDGIADAYELQWVGNLLVMDSTTDQDRDGVLDRDEFLADTNPTDPADFLRITAIRTVDAGRHCDITWTSRPTRQYRIQKLDSFAPDTAWVDSGLGLQVAAPGLTTTRTVPDAAADHRFFRVQAVNPLSP